MKVKSKIYGYGDNMDERMLEYAVHLVTEAMDNVSGTDWFWMTDEEKKIWCENYYLRYSAAIKEKESESIEMGEEKVFDTVKLSQLIAQAEEYKKSLKDVKETYKDLHECGGGKAVLNIIANGYNTEVLLDNDTVVVILEALRNRYVSLIKESRREVNKLYSNFLGGAVDVD